MTSDHAVFADPGNVWIQRHSRRELRTVIDDVVVKHETVVSKPPHKVMYAITLRTGEEWVDRTVTQFHAG